MKFQPLPEPVEEFKKALFKESDRGCALIAASFLDCALEEALQAKLIDNPKAFECLFGQSGPLGSFSSRIDMAYMLGLVSDITRRELHLIRKIRNDFGHSPTAVDFSSPVIKNRCSELKIQLFENVPSRRMFEHSTFALLGTIHLARNKAQRTESPDEIQIGMFKEIGRQLQSGAKPESTSGEKGAE